MQVEGNFFNIHQPFRLQRSFEIQKLDPQRKAHLLFLKSQLGDLAKLQQLLEDGVRKLFFMQVPNKCRDQIHISMADSLAALDCVRVMSEHINMLFWPDATFETVIRLQSIDKGPAMSDSRKKLWHTICKEEKEKREERQKSYNQGKKFEGHCRKCNKWGHKAQDCNVKPRNYDREGGSNRDNRENKGNGAGANNSAK